MKRGILLIALTGIALALAGCLPKKHIVWSPDGARAAVIGGDAGLYLCSPDGELSERLAENVNEVAWLPDSGGLVVVHDVKIETWQALAAELEPDYVQQLTRLGELLHAEAMAYEGDWDHFEPRGYVELGGREFAALILYLRDVRPEGLRAKLGTHWEDLEKLEVPITRLQLMELDGEGLHPGAVLAQSLGVLSEPTVSPDGRHVAYISLAPLGVEAEFGRPISEFDRRWLYVALLESDDAPRPVNRACTLSLDWAPDGSHLAYSAASAPLTPDDDAMQLGVVKRRAVCDLRGGLLDEFPEAEALAGIVFNIKESARVRCLPDGRIVFATLELHLPATTADMPQQFGLFAVDPDRQPTVLRLIPRAAEAALPGAVFLFDPSPDGEHICIPGTNGEIGVLTIATGAVRLVLADEEIDRLRTQTAWRSAGELTFAVVPGEAGDKGRPELALYDLDWDADEPVQSRTILSAAWPEEVVTGLLKDPQQDQETNPE